MAGQNEPSPHLSVPEAARLLRVDPRTVRADIASGRLPAKRVGARGLLRIDPGDLNLLATEAEDRGPASRRLHPAARRRREGTFRRFAREAASLSGTDGATEVES